MEFKKYFCVIFVLFFVLFINLIASLSTPTELPAVKLIIASMTSYWTKKVVYCTDCTPKGYYSVDGGLDSVDSLPMIGIHDNFWISTGEINVRHYYYPVRLVAYTKNKKYYNLDSSNTLDFTRPLNDSGKEYANPHFGTITKLGNWFVKKLYGYEGQNVTHVRIPKSPPHNIKKPGTRLIGITSFNRRIEANYIHVLPFNTCKEIWSPADSLHQNIVDEQQQICTEAADHYVGRKKGPQAIVASLILAEDGENGYFLIGTESSVNGKVSLSTFLPYYCNQIKKLHNITVCSHN